jgi:DMSO/TMAO reductase YedYZ molybdopterin-dependent catalytic subunit
LRRRLGEAEVPVKIPVESDFTSRWHDERVASRVGLWLGVTFSICFVTGLLSHLIQHPVWWFVWPTRPVWLYRVTQGLHVVTGIAAVPLLLVKLWTVYPRFFVQPPLRSLGHGLERLSVLALVSSALFELITGLQNIAHWYPWGFSFPRAHFAVAWIAIGAIVVHVAVKLPAIQRGLTGPVDDDPAPPGSDPGAREVVTAGPSRRWLLGAAFSSAGVAVLTTAGMSVPWLRRVSVLAVRSGTGPQGVPVNKSAVAAGVTDTAPDPRWRLTIVGPSGRLSLSRAELLAMPQHSARLPIACVEGWSAGATWSGVRVRDLAAAVGAPAHAQIRFSSLQQGGAYRVSVLPARHVTDELSLVALRINGTDLDLDHGFPARLITASRPGVLQTKWLTSLEVLP